HVLFEDELERVGERLEEAERTDAIRARAVLNERAPPPLHPNHDRRDVEHGPEDDGDLQSREPDVNPIDAVHASTPALLPARTPGSVRSRGTRRHLCRASPRCGDTARDR